MSPQILQSSNTTTRRSCESVLVAAKLIGNFIAVSRKQFTRHQDKKRTHSLSERRSTRDNMCKIKQLRYQCGHKYDHRPSRCAQAEPGEAYVCRRLVYLPLLQIRTYCAPCSKRQYCDHFYSEYKKFVESGADNEAVRKKWEEYEEACGLLDKMCSRDQPFWEHMSREDYEAAVGKLDSAPKKEAPSEIDDRKKTEILTYWLRTAKSTTPKPLGVKRDNSLDEKSPSTNADLLQQLFAKASPKKETVEESMDNLTLREDNHATDSTNEVPDANEGVCTLLATTSPPYPSPKTTSKWSVTPGVKRQEQRCDIPVASHYGM